MISVFGWQRLSCWLDFGAAEAGAQNSVGSKNAGALSHRQGDGRENIHAIVVGPIMPKICNFGPFQRFGVING